MLTVRRDLELPLAAYLEGLHQAESFHGHLCPGMFTGVKMALLARELLGYQELPNKDLIVIAEIDRCLTDAIMSFTGCRLGRRTLKFRDLGKFAATFCSLEHGQGFRVATTARSFDEINRRLESAGIDPHDREKAARVFFSYPWQDHFTVAVVPIAWSENDLPGLPRVRTRCSVCQEPVMDNRHIVRNGQDICQTCALSSSRESGA